MSTQTADAIRRLTSDREFKSRTASANARFTQSSWRSVAGGGFTQRFNKGHPVVSLTRANAAYYTADAPNFRFTVAPGASPERVNAVLMDLGKLGVSPSQIDD
jgi:hypothetical protein